VPKPFASDLLVTIVVEALASRREMANAPEPDPRVGLRPWCLPKWMVGGA